MPTKYRTYQPEQSYLLALTERLAAQEPPGGLAWPHLPAHPKGHDREMRELFKRLLASFRDEPGPCQLKPGEVVRRPNA